MKHVLCCAIAALPSVGASWFAAPLSDFPSEESEEGGGVRHFWHREHCELNGGGHLSLNWNLHADPASILSLDAEHPSDVQMHDCQANRLVLRLPARLVKGFEAFKFVVASRHRHVCAHLKGDHSYHRVLRVVSASNRRPLLDVIDVVLATRELASASEVVPRATFSFSYLPAEALSANPSEVGVSQVKQCASTLSRRLHAAPRTHHLQHSNRSKMAAHQNWERPTVPPMMLSNAATVPASKNDADARPALVMTMEGLGKQHTGDEHPVHLQQAFVTEQKTSTLTTTVTVSSTPGIPERLQVENQSPLNFVPRKIANFGLNWDFERNQPNETEFQMGLPGGKGFLLFSDPAVHIHAGIFMNFSSHTPVPGEAVPVVKLSVVLEGRTYIGGDMSATFDISEDPALGGSPTDFMGSRWELTQMESLEFFLGNIPIRLTPGASLGLDATYLGELRGSFRLGLQARLNVRAELDFDSNSGLRTSFKFEPLDGQFWPPTWLLHSERFGLNAVLKPKVWLDASLGNLRNVRLELGVKPNLNISLVQEALPPGPHILEEGQQKQLVVYPFRAVGLPVGEDFAVKITANGHERTTSVQLGFGVIEYSDDAENFDFGLIGEVGLLMNDIQVSLLRGGREPAVATATVSCESHVNGECTPSPGEVLMKVDGQDVLVQMTMLWKRDALSSLQNRIRGISISFQDMRLTPSISAEVLAARERSEPVHFQLTRNGHMYIAPVEVNGSNEKAVILSSSRIFELGPCYLDSWRAHLGMDGSDELGLDIPARLQELVAPTLELLINGQTAGRAGLSEISWDLAGAVKRPKLDATIFDNGDDRQIGSIPIAAAMREPQDKKSIGMAGLNIGVVDAEVAPCWVYPDKVEHLLSESSFSLSWTASATAAESITFVIEAFQLSEKGHVQAKPVTKHLDLTCRNMLVNVKNTYRRNAYPCIFNTTLELSESLRRHLVFVVKWTRDGREHMMPSVPVDFIAASEQARRMSWLPHSDKTFSFGALIVQTTDVDFNAKMKELNPQCSDLPLHYSITAGTELRAKVLGDQAGWADFDSGWQALSGSADSVGALAGAALLPACQNGACSGQLPDCAPGALPDMRVPHLEFELSRHFSWTNASLKGVRNVMAFGLAVLPEAVDIAVAMDPMRISGPHREPHPRRLSSFPSTSRQFSVRFTEPLLYRLDLTLAASLLRAGAWRGLKDGREAEFGDVTIKRVVVGTSGNLRHTCLTGCWTHWTSIFGIGVVATACIGVGLVLFLLCAWRRAGAQQKFLGTAGEVEYGRVPAKVDEQVRCD